MHKKVVKLSRSDRRWVQQKREECCVYSTSAMSQIVRRFSSLANNPNTLRPSERDQMLERTVVNVYVAELERRGV